MAPSSKALEFLSSYRKAFASKDADAVAAHFFEPMLVYSEGNAVLFQNRQVAAAAITDLLSVYDRMGMRNAEVTSTDAVLRESDVEIILVNWTLHGDKAQKLVSFKTSYTLITDHKHVPRCLSAISHNEMLEIRKFLSANGRER